MGPPVLKKAALQLCVAVAVLTSPADLLANDLVQEGATVRYQVAVAGDAIGEIISVTTWNEHQVVRTSRLARTPQQQHLELADWDAPDLGEMHFKLEDADTGQWVALVVDLGLLAITPNDYGPTLRARLDEEGGTVSLRLSTPEDSWELTASQPGSAGLTILDTWVGEFRRADAGLDWSPSLAEGARFLFQTTGHGAPLDPILKGFLGVVGWPTEEGFVRRNPDDRWKVTEEALTKGQANRDLRELMKSFPSLSRSEIARILETSESNDL